MVGDDGHTVEMRGEEKEAVVDAGKRRSAAVREKKRQKRRRGCGGGPMQRGAVILMLANDPGVFGALLGRVSLRGVLHQQMADQILCVLRHILPAGIVKVVLHLHDLLEQRRSVVGVKRRVAAQQNVDDHTHRPHIDRVIVILVGQHLRKSAVRKNKNKTKYEFK